MTDWIEAIVKARFLVACLGEITSPPWWRSEAMRPASLRMLERIYPRTFLAASLETASRAAIIEHDAHIGRIGTYHLFRLPTADETVIQTVALSPQGNLLLRELTALDGRESLLAALGDLAAGAQATPVQGPTRCGTIGDIRSGRAVRRICAAYVYGFSESARVYPYLDTESLP